MKTVTLQDIKSRGAQAIPDGQTAYLIVNSKPKSVLVPPAEYDMLIEALEELEDTRAMEARKSEKTVGWNEVFPKRRR